MYTERERERDRHTHIHRHTHRHTHTQIHTKSTHTHPTHTDTHTEHTHTPHTQTQRQIGRVTQRQYREGDAKRHRNNNTYRQQTKSGNDEGQKVKKIDTKIETQRDRGIQRERLCRLVRPHS